MSCHGPGYKRIYAGWVSAANDRTEAMRRLMEANAGVMGGPAEGVGRRAPQLPARQPRARRAQRHVRVRGAREGLRAAQRGVRSAVSRRPASRGRRLEQPVLSRHTGIESRWASSSAAFPARPAPRRREARLREVPSQALRASEGRDRALRSDGCTTCHHENLPADKFRTASAATTTSTNIGARRARRVLAQSSTARTVRSASPATSSNTATHALRRASARSVTTDPRRGGPLGPPCSWFGAEARER